jgi:hypothetical protein
VRALARRDEGGTLRVHNAGERLCETGRRVPIKYGEWLRVVRKDPELRMSRGENKGLTLWKGYPDREEIRFDLCGGDVVAESPD